MTQTSTPTQERTDLPARRIPPPKGDREPLKANVFQVMSGAACALLPLFPYDGAGAIVPCGAIFTGDPEDSEYGQFFHYNTVEEVAVSFGANGAMLQSGQIFVTQQLHGVNSFLKNPTDPEAFSLLTITQHQSEDVDRPQSEAVLLRCGKCSEQLHRHDYDGTPKGVEGYDPSQWGGTVDDKLAPFVSIWGCLKAVADYSKDESARTCPKCGHENDAYPIAKWGWQRYVEQTRTAESAHKAFRSAAETSLSEPKDA